MIKVDYLGRLGNNMFQYALGRYLAEEMGYELGAAPLPFDATNEKILGHSFQWPQEEIGLFHINLPGLIANKANRAIKLRGFFQHYRYYEPFVDRIRRWFEYPANLPVPRDTSKEDLLIYIRLGDYSDVEMHLKYSYYEAAIKMAQPRRITIVTEDKNHPFLREFDSYDPVIISQDPLSDLGIARSFKKIAISCSTFSWWAALLAEPDEVYFPIGNDGHWSPSSMQPPNYNQDLRIDDSRYVYFYNCAIASSRSPESGYLSLIDANPDSEFLRRFVQQSQIFHKKSKAYWFS